MSAIKMANQHIGDQRLYVNWQAIGGEGEFRHTSELPVESTEYMQGLRPFG